MRMIKKWFSLLFSDFFYHALTNTCHIKVYNHMNYGELELLNQKNMKVSLSKKNQKNKDSIYESCVFEK